MTTLHFENRNHHSFSLRQLARFSFLASVLAFGLAHAATADVSVEYMNGALTGPQLFEGTGYHSITLMNNSDQLATFSLARLHAGSSVGDYTAANDAFTASLDGQGDSVAAVKNLLALADALSGTEVKAHTEITMFADLQQGTYVVSAFADGDEGALSAPTYLPFMVTASGTEAAAPEASYVVHFSDFAFDFPATVDAGSNLWEISNTGEQPHIAVFFKLLPDKTMAELETFLNDETGQAGPPPFDTDVMLDLEALSPGQTVYMPLDMAAGEWVAVCFVQDLENPELSHAMEGMIQEFAVN